MGVKRVCKNLVFQMKGIKNTCVWTVLSFEEYLTEYWIRFVMLRFFTVFRKLKCPIHSNPTSLLYSFSYLAVHSSAEAVRVLCRRGDQPSLRTALQVFCKALRLAFSSLLFSLGLRISNKVCRKSPTSLLFKVEPSGSNEHLSAPGLNFFFFSL